MPVKLVPQGEAFTHPGVTKAQIKKMKDAFKTHPGGGANPAGLQKETTVFAHFPLKNIMDLLVVNGIVDNNRTVAEVKNIKNFAIRIYFAQHVDKTDCPKETEDYIGRNTVVLVNATNASGKWEDMLSDDPAAPNSVETSGFGDDTPPPPGSGTDKVNLCPPQCE